MKTQTSLASRHTSWLCITLTLWLAAGPRGNADPALVLFQDDFTGGIPGWTAVRPVLGVYLDGPMLWEYDKVTDSFSEQSNQYTDSATFSSSRIAVMLISDSNSVTNFTYSARLTAGDNDAFGLIFGYTDENTFYRVYFAQQNRALAGWPFQGWGVDRMNNGQYSDLFGPSQSWVNTLGRPFDVIITVSSGLLDLTVVDDPLGGAGGPYTNNLVAGGALAGYSDGKLGIFSWGQAGSIPRAFRVQNPAVLSPPTFPAFTYLSTAASNNVLSNWSFTVTPSGTNDYDVVSQPGLWSQGLGINGDRGAMIENNDQAPENVATSYTNCPVYAAVAGDSLWSNYVYSARFISSDDDGLGMLLRYQNRSNWYRIAFRNQSTAAGGIRRGISIQKSVNKVFDQFLSSTAFIPAIGTPFELHASISTNMLQVICVANPDSPSPTMTSFGPLDMSASVIVPATLDTGKVGIFSWAQYNATVTDDAGTQVDWVKVREVLGAGLLVSSGVGTPFPPVGLNDFPVGTLLTLTNNSLVNISATERQVCIGWTGIGSVPASGSANTVAIQLTNLSSVNWRFQTEYLLTTNVSGGGSIIATNGPWVPANQSTTLRAVVSPGYVFTGWSGDTVLSSSTNLTFPMIRPVSVTANFAVDSDGDGLADTWELQYFASLAQGAAGDADGDGQSNLAEFQNGTNPASIETLLVSDGLSSQWTNTCRDAGLPGEITVMDFGPGYRGAFNSDNVNRPSDDATVIPAAQLSNNVSFQTQRIVSRTNNPTWGTNFSAMWETSVGDNDGVCFYFRYNNESNWFRATLCGEDPLGSVTRPFLGLSVQGRTNGFHFNVPINNLTGPAYAAYLDPTDGSGTPAGFKKVRVTVNSTNQEFEIKVIGWDFFLGTPDFNPAYELVGNFSNSTPLLHGGRIGFGPWGEGGFGSNTNQVHDIPIPFGAFIDNIVVRSPNSNGPVVLSENWDSFPLATNLPAGWTNPFVGVPNLQGNWVVNVDGSISQLANQGAATTGTALDPKADADGPILIAPDQMSRNYYLQIGFHQFDNDGVGFVYDFQDTNNYSRVIFRQEATYATDVPPGLSVWRKSGGVWSETTSGDPAFLYTPARPFELTFGNNNGDYNLVVRNLDNLAAAVTRWHWTGPPAAPTNRFGITTWASQGAHMLYARAYGLPYIPTPFAITNVTLSGGNVILDISKPAADKYHLLRATNVAGPYVTNAANQTVMQFIEPAPGSQAYYRLQYVP